jgi:AcrR family transcriptional regulator
VAGRGSRKRARLDPAERRAQLVDVAYRLLGERGAPNLSVDDVADAADVSRSLVYAYFGDRDSLFAEVYLRILERLDEALAPRRYGDMQHDEATMAAVVAGCMHFAREQPAAWRLLVTDAVRSHPSVMTARAARVEQLVHGRSDGRDGRDTHDEHLVADALLGLVEAGVLHWVERPELDPDTAALLLARVVWSGLAGMTVL